MTATNEMAATKWAPITSVAYRVFVILPDGTPGMIYSCTCMEQVKCIACALSEVGSHFQVEKL